MTPLKQRGKIRRTNIYTMGEEQTGKYMYYKSERHDSTKPKGEDQTDKYMYYKIEQDDSMFSLIVYIFVRLIIPFSVYMCSFDIPPRF
jgi:hypothetical protein